MLCSPAADLHQLRVCATHEPVLEPLPAHPAPSYTTLCLSSLPGLTAIGRFHTCSVSLAAFNTSQAFSSDFSSSAYFIRQTSGLTFSPEPSNKCPFFTSFLSSVSSSLHHSGVTNMQLQDLLTSMTSSERCSISRGCEHDQVGTSLSSFGYKDRTSPSTEKHQLLFAASGCSPFTFMLSPLFNLSSFWNLDFVFFPLAEARSVLQQHFS